MLKKVAAIVATAAMTASLASGTAEARSWHRSYQPGYVTQVQYYSDNCRDQGDEVAGTILGAIIGGAIGNQFGKGSGRTAATVAGVVLGGAIGNSIARDLPCDDQRYAYDAQYQGLEYGDPYEDRYWRSEETGNYGYFQPADYYEDDYGRDCRNYTQTIYIDGRREVGHGTACRGRDGKWEIVN